MEFIKYWVLAAFLVLMLAIGANAAELTVEDKAELAVETTSMYQILDIPRELHYALDALGEFSGMWVFMLQCKIPREDFEVMIPQLEELDEQIIEHILMTYGYILEGEIEDAEEVADDGLKLIQKQFTMLEAFAEAYQDNDAVHCDVGDSNTPPEPMVVDPTSLKHGI